MGNSIEQHRSAIGSFNARKKNKKEGPDLFWVSLRDLVLVVVTLQLLFLGILALQCNLSLHASLDADVLIFSPVAGKVEPLWLPQVLNQGLSHQCTCFSHVWAGALT